MTTKSQLGVDPSRSDRLAESTATPSREAGTPPGPSPKYGSPLKPSEKKNSLLVLNCDFLSVRIIRYEAKIIVMSFKAIIMIYVVFMSDKVINVFEIYNGLSYL